MVDKIIIGRSAVGWWLRGLKNNYSGKVSINIVTLAAKHNDLTSLSLNNEKISSCVLNEVMVLSVVTAEGF